MKKQLKDLCKFEDSKRNFKLSSPLSIRFIPQVLGDDDERETITLDLRLSQEEPTKPQVTFKDGTAGGSREEDKDVPVEPPAKAVEKAVTYKQKFRKLCHGTAEDYLK